MTRPFQGTDRQPSTTLVVSVIFPLNAHQVFAWLGSDRTSSRKHIVLTTPTSIIHARHSGPLEG